MTTTRQSNGEAMFRIFEMVYKVIDLPVFDVVVVVIVVIEFSKFSKNHPKHTNQPPTIHAMTMARQSNGGAMFRIFEMV